MIGDYIEAGYQTLLDRGIQKIRGAETGAAVRVNRAYIDSILIEMRMIDAVERPSTEFQLFGKSFTTPIMSAALSGLNTIRPNGMVQVAEGVAAANTCMWAGIGTEKELEEIIATGAPTIKIVKPYRDDDRVLQKIQHAEAVGCLAVGMDIDFFFGAQVGEKVTFSDSMAPKSSKQMKQFIGATKLPFILKGVLSEQDAQKAVEIGAAAVVISHHSGSVMDYAVPPMMMLPKIKQILKGKIPIIIDGDIKRGSDAYKALALGADGVLVGRSLMAGLEIDGSAGVEKVLNGMTEELRRIMGQTSCAVLADIKPDCLAAPINTPLPPISPPTDW